jgi:hypothetical protein
MACGDLGSPVGDVAAKDLQTELELVPGEPSGMARDGARLPGRRHSHGGPRWSSCTCVDRGRPNLASLHLVVQGPREEPTLPAFAMPDVRLCRQHPRMCGCSTNGLTSRSEADLAV